MSYRQDMVEVELELNRKHIQESQVFRGAGNGDWNHVIFIDKATAESCAQQVYKDGIAMAVPKVCPRDPTHHARYPEGTFFFRVHKSAFEKFKDTYSIKKDVTIYDQKQQQAKESESGSDKPNSCAIS